MLIIMFIGRKNEIDVLTRMIEFPSPSIAVIYGRRRIGKSELIKQVTRNRVVFKFEGVENESQQNQIKNFLFQFKEQTGLPTGTIKTWSEALILLKQVSQQGEVVIVFDEFQWMANYQKHLVSTLKMIWDQYLSENENLSLILCGSIASFMIKKVVHSSAFYGRTDCILELRGFKLKEMQEYFPNKGIDEILDMSLLLGGVPKYMDLVARYSTVYEAIEELAFDSKGYLWSEFDRIFTSHFGKDSSYGDILEVLAQYPYGLSVTDISKKLNITAGGTLSSQLSDLQSAGFIHRNIPFDKKVKSKLAKFMLIDPYLRLYHYLIKELRDRHATSPFSFQNFMSSPKYYSWMGRSFELLCLIHHQEIATILGFSGVEYTHGPYYSRGAKDTRGVQVDLVFYRQDKVLVLCEMKFNSGTISNSVLEDVIEKEQVLRQKFPSSTILKVLVTKSRPPKSVSESPIFYRIIEAAELFRV